MSPSLGTPVDDLEDLAVPLGVKLGGGMSMLTGAFTLGLAIQTGLMLRMRGAQPIIVVVMLALGAACVVTGWGTTRGQSRSAVGAAAAGGLVATLGTAWAIVGLMSGLISPLSFFVVLLATASAIMAGLAIGPAGKITRARHALRAQGLDFGM